MSPASGQRRVQILAEPGSEEESSVSELASDYQALLAASPEDIYVYRFPFVKMYLFA
jgi:hypothetical protein